MPPAYPLSAVHRTPRAAPRRTERRGPQLRGRSAPAAARPARPRRSPPAASRTSSLQVPLRLVEHPAARRPRPERHRREHPDGLDDQPDPDPFADPRNQRRPRAPRWPSTAAAPRITGQRQPLRRRTAGDEHIPITAATSSARGRAPRPAARPSARRATRTRRRCPPATATRRAHPDGDHPAAAPPDQPGDRGHRQPQRAAAARPAGRSRSRTGTRTAGTPARPPGSSAPARPPDRRRRSTSRPGSRAPRREPVQVVVHVGQRDQQQHAAAGQVGGERPVGDRASHRDRRS